ncbi:hypothetical protein [Alicyclobacillus cellulosilyticus]|uniref:hypothetical protein n=1 Tax=Alicyclobacillus cellulosilyticus TaxID=1003997 RepID=UPI00166BC587|nr:hypothetical protein [Alicyclobacillus cellulosilyticus]
MTSDRGAPASGSPLGPTAPWHPPCAASRAKRSQNGRMLCVNMSRQASAHAYAPSGIRTLVCIRAERRRFHPGGAVPPLLSPHVGRFKI